MKILDDGRYQLDDGRILTQDEVIKLHEKAPSRKKEPQDTELAEGQSSGPVRLED